jgi:hypothetical protein
MEKFINEFGQQTRATFNLIHQGYSFFDCFIAGNKKKNQLKQKSSLSISDDTHFFLLKIMIFCQ